MRTPGNQKGITMIGFAMLLCLLGFVAYAVMKLFPVYSEYYGVVKAMKSLQQDAAIESATIDQIRSKLNVQFDLQYVDESHIPPSSMQLSTANGEHSLRIAYDREVPFLYNVD